MANRRLARRAHHTQKKKLKLAKKISQQEVKEATAKLQAKKYRKKGDKRGVPVSPIDALRKERSVMFKKHAKERVALRDHIRELEERRSRIKKGANAKTERRELGKYIRQLREELIKRHKEESNAIEAQLEKVIDQARQKKHGQTSHEHGKLNKKSNSNINANNTWSVYDESNMWEDVNDDDDDIDANNLDQLQDMFAHLTT